MTTDEVMAQSAEQVAPDVTAVTAQESSERAAAGAKAIASLRPGMAARGKVRNVVDFGAFVDIGVGREGLVHISVLQRAGIDKTLKVGDVIDVVVRNVDAASNRISLTLPATERGPKAALSDLAVGATVTGRVVRLADFGAFVDIGAETDALLHVSQLGRGFAARPGDVLKVGEEVQVRILDVDTQRRRISLTMRGVEADMPEPEPAPQESVSSTAEEEPVTGVFAAAWEKAVSQRRARRRRPGA